MTDTKFVYVTYIASTVEKVWDALIKAEATRRYWLHENVSDWKPGSEWRHVRADGSQTVDIAGEVVESDRPRRLVMTWANPADAADKSKHSRVAIDLEQVEDMVRLTVTHDELKAGSDMLRGITHGWPLVLSSMKSFLETGNPLKLVWTPSRAA